MAADDPSRRQLNGQCLIGCAMGRLAYKCGKGVSFLVGSCPGKTLNSTLSLSEHSGAFGSPVYLWMILNFVLSCPFGDRHERIGSGVCSF